MRIIVFLMAITLCFTSLAIAEDPPDLPQKAMERVQQQTREMSSLGIPQEPAQKMLTQMVRNRFQQHSVARAQQVVMEAARAGLPTEPVMSKAMEGMAKQVKERHIVAAMEKVVNRHAYGQRMARELSGQKKNQAEIAAAIADSLAAGMAHIDMDKVMAQLQARNRQAVSDDHQDKLALQTMLTVRTMARMGVGSPAVSDTLRQAIQHRYSWQEMKSLRTQMAKQAHTASPRQIAHQHAGDIGKGGGKGDNAGTGSGQGHGGSDSGGSGSGGDSSGGSGSGGSGGSGSGGSGGSGSGGSGGGGNGGGKN